LYGQYQLVAFMDCGLPFLKKLKNVIGVRHKHWPKQSETRRLVFSVKNKGTIITSLARRLAIGSFVALLLLKKSPEMSDDVEVDWAAHKFFSKQPSYAPSSTYTTN
jgi:hypothetical protein